MIRSLHFSFFGVLNAGLSLIRDPDWVPRIQESGGHLYPAIITAVRSPRVLDDMFLRSNPDNALA